MIPTTRKKLGGKNKESKAFTENNWRISAKKVNASSLIEEDRGQSASVSKCLGSSIKDLIERSLEI